VVYNVYTLNVSNMGVLCCGETTHSILNMLCGLIGSLYSLIATCPNYNDVIIVIIMIIPMIII